MFENINKVKLIHHLWRNIMVEQHNFFMVILLAVTFFHTLSCWWMLSTIRDNILKFILAYTDFSSNRFTVVIVSCCKRKLCGNGFQVGENSRMCLPASLMVSFWDRFCPLFLSVIWKFFISHFRLCTDDLKIYKIVRNLKLFTVDWWIYYRYITFACNCFVKALPSIYFI